MVRAQACHGFTSVTRSVAKPFRCLEEIGRPRWAQPLNVVPNQTSGDLHRRPCVAALEQPVIVEIGVAIFVDVTERSSFGIYRCSGGCEVTDIELVLNSVVVDVGIASIAQTVIVEVSLHWVAHNVAIVARAAHHHANR